MLYLGYLYAIGYGTEKGGAVDIKHAHIYEFTEIFKYIAYETKINYTLICCDTSCRL
jgi:hypothetical protein